MAEDFLLYSNDVERVWKRRFPVIRLYNEATNALIGEISEQDFAFLQGDLEEESSTDNNYYINQATVDMFEEQKANPALVSLLRKALGGNEDMDIRWDYA